MFQWPAYMEVGESCPRQRTRGLCGVCYRDFAARLKGEDDPVHGPPASDWPRGARGWESRSDWSEEGGPCASGTREALARG